MAVKSIPYILEEIASLLEIKGENPFKSRAYYNAAKILSGVDDLDRVIKEKKLQDIKGIGEAIAAKIEEYSQTGRMSYLEELKKEVPESLLELMQIPNLGPKKIKVLYDDLGITNVGELEYACKENRLVNLSGFGEKTQEKILKGIEFVGRHKGEYLVGDVYPLAHGIKEKLEKEAKGSAVEVCGSIRRRKEIVRDIDILVGGGDAERISSFFASLPEVEDVLVSGETKTSCRLKSGIEADLRVVGEKQFPYALLYFTGNKEHNVKLRGIAKKKGLKLNEYGLFKGEDLLHLKDEEEIYKKLGLAYIEPELREDTGEIEAAEQGKLPELVDIKDIKGTFHVHTEFSDGVDSIEKMVEAAKHLGLTYIGISDHSKSAYYAGGLKYEDLRRQWEIIDARNAREKTFRILKGIESDILPDGSLDYDEEILKQFDFVIGSVHSSFQLKKDDQEARIIRAMESPHMTMLGHPTGRLLLSRDGYNVDMHTIIDAAARTRTMIELNASPYRLDIDWRYLKYARDKGVMISINPDAHAAQGLTEIFYGVGIARKGWLTSRDVLNTRTADEIVSTLKRHKSL
ncbi:MAG TPA: DNA polymerase/3'-5' exonuclease PolX [Syntrophorhabdaceae bacterium]|nr:DNA polymerase/3'-5' exonuclease PolX [Syntrophorhabdaceae bacterium]